MELLDILVGLVLSVAVCAFFTFCGVVAWRWPELRRKYVKDLEKQLTEAKSLNISYSRVLSNIRKQTRNFDEIDHPLASLINHELDSFNN